MRLLAVVAVVIAFLGPAVPASAWEHRPGDWTPGGLSLEAPAPAMLNEVLGEPLASGEAFIEPISFRLDVPFRTQKDGSRWQGSNCGPAILGMVLDGFGVPGQSTDDLRFRSHTYQGTVGMRTGTALDHIAHVAEDFGLRTHGLYGANGSWRSWSEEDIRAELRLGRPVMPLVRLYLLPGYENSLPRWGHYILITGMDERGFYYSDPLQLDAVNGTGGYVSAQRLLQAMHASHIPGQALAFSGGSALRWQTLS